MTHSAPPTPSRPTGDRLPTLPTIGGASPCQENACSQCCHDTEMLLTAADMARLRAATGRDDWWFEADDGFWQLALQDAPPVPGHHGAPCVFLDPAGRCTVREARPEGCRLYPAVWDGAAILDREHCPHTDGFELPAWADSTVRRLADRLVRERDARAG